MKQLVKYFVVFFVCSTLFGQQIPVRSDHSVYSFLYRQSTVGILPQWVQSTKPLTLDQVLNLLTQVIENREIGNANRALAARFKSEFSIPTKPGMHLPFSESNKINHLLYYESADIEPHLLTMTHEKSSLWLDWTEALVFTPSNDYERYYQDKFTLKTKINDRVSAYSQFSMNRLVWNNKTLAIESVLPPDTIDWVTYHNEWAKYFPEVNWIIWYNTQAGVSIIFDQIRFNLGKQNHSWGWSPSHSPILSGTGQPFAFIGLKTSISKIRFKFLHGSLMPFTPYEVHRKKITPNKYISAHRAEIDITNNFTLSISEMVIYGNRNMDFDYLIPSHWYWAGEHNRGDQDNLLIGLDYSWRIRPGIRIYQTLLLDEVTWVKIFKPWWGNKFVFQSGIHWVPSVNPIIPDFRLEYTISRPFTYTHEDTINTYSTAGLGLGFPYGPSAEVLRIETNLFPKSRLFASGAVDWIRKGSGMGSSIFDNYAFRDPALDNNTPVLLAPVNDKSVITLALHYTMSRYIMLHSNFAYSSNTDIEIRVGLTWDW
jgi:hypothetical protein